MWSKKLYFAWRNLLTTPYYNPKHPQKCALILHRWGNFYLSVHFFSASCKILAIVSCSFFSYSSSLQHFLKKKLLKEFARNFLRSKFFDCWTKFPLEWIIFQRKKFRQWNQQPEYVVYSENFHLDNILGKFLIQQFFVLHGNHFTDFSWKKIIIINIWKKFWKNLKGRKCCFYALRFPPKSTFDLLL